MVLLDSVWCYLIQSDSIERCLILSGSVWFCQMSAWLCVWFCSNLFDSGQLVLLYLSILRLPDYYWFRLFLFDSVWLSVGRLSHCLADVVFVRLGLSGGVWFWLLQSILYCCLSQCLSGSLWCCLILYGVPSCSVPPDGFWFYLSLSISVRFCPIPSWGCSWICRQMVSFVSDVCWFYFQTFWRGRFSWFCPIACPIVCLISWFCLSVCLIPCASVRLSGCLSFWFCLILSDSVWLSVCLFVFVVDLITSSSIWFTVVLSGPVRCNLLLSDFVWLCSMLSHYAIWFCLMMCNMCEALWFHPSLFDHLSVSLILCLILFKSM